MTEETAFQRLIDGEEQAAEMIDDLNDLDGLLDEEQDPEEVDGWELAMRFSEDDIPYLLEELEEMVDGEP
jgi:hypothetical protein